MPVERRSYKRYPAAGQAEFWSTTLKGAGELLDVAKGGVLIRSADVPSEESGITVLFTVSGYQRMFEAEGRVVRAQLDTIAVMFFDEPAGLEELLRWLERPQGETNAR